MQNRWLIMVLVVSLAMNTAFVAVAGYAYFRNPVRPRSDKHSPSERDSHFYKVLELDQAQMQKMIPLATSFHERLNRLHGEMERKKEAMLSKLSGEQPSIKQIETLRREMAAIQDKLQKTVIAHIIDVKAILDAGQRKRFFDLLRESMTQEHSIFGSPGNK
jgi:Spy/CpxP family protein refolding chaperone